MMNRFAAPLLALAVLATPAVAIQEVTLGPRAPSFVASGAGMGWEALPLPGVPAALTASEWREAPRWAFQGGETQRLGSFLFNTRSGPNWAADGGLGFSPFSLSRGGFDALGFTTRSTAAVMATESLMFYTSVGNTTSGFSAAPVAPGLQTIEGPQSRTDVRAGFKMQLVPGVTFGMEAAFSPAQR
jgi:hypothetical protein